MGFKCRKKVIQTNSNVKLDMCVYWSVLSGKQDFRGNYMYTFELMCVSIPRKLLDVASFFCNVIQ